MPTGFDHPETRAHVRLLGPCFKTGRMEPYGRQHLRRVVCEHRPIDWQQFERTGVPSATVDMPDRSFESPARHASQKPRSSSSYASTRLNNRPRGPVQLPRVLVARRQPTLARHTLSPVNSRRSLARPRLVHADRELARRKAQAAEAGRPNC